MKSTPQTKTQSVWKHGQSVQNYMFDLLDHLQKGIPLKNKWRLPQWIYDPLLIQNLPDRETIELYTLYHDIGKPFCIRYDSDGRKHFPNHSEVSYNIFKIHFTNDISAQLILRDMDMHLLKSDGVEKFMKFEYFDTLILSSLSELHSNAIMFGGIESTSFKIKWKNINRRGNQILKIMNNKNK